MTTSIGMEGTGLINGKHLLVADSAEEFAGSVEKLLNDRSHASALVRSVNRFLLKSTTRNGILSSHYRLCCPVPEAITHETIRWSAAKTPSG